MFFCCFLSSVLNKDNKQVVCSNVGVAKTEWCMLGLGGYGYSLAVQTGLQKAKYNTNC